MPVKKSILIRLILLTLFVLLTLSAPVSAAITGFIARDSDGKCYEYAYDDLLDSYAMKILGLSNGLYEDFAAKETFALINEHGSYIEYKDVLDRYAMALLSAEQFNLHQYVSGNEAKKAVMPASINQAKLVSGKVVFTARNIGASNPESNPSVDPPKTKTAISGPAEVTLEQAQLWAAGRNAHQRFIDIATLYWQYGEKTGLRAEVLYAQAGLDTNFGRYGNQVPPEYNNWAGIKKADNADQAGSAYESFATPEDGVRAHFNHMAAYLGLSPLGEPHARYHLTVQQSWAGSVLFVEDLSGKWAPALDYHVYLLTLLDQMYKTKSTDSGEGNEKETTPPAETKPEEGNGSTNNTVAVNVDILRLRSGPGTNHDILDRLVRGTVLTVQENQNEWLKVITPDQKNGWVHGEYVVAVTSTVDALKGKTIVIDPGHGGSDPGAIGVTGLQEKVVNLAVTEHLVKLLKSAGANVIVTRSSDQSVSNQQRVDMANKAKADIFVSIHANAFSNPESNGTETHYCGNNSSSSASRYLAQQLQRELVPALGLRDRGVKINSFFVLTRVEMPAALIELAFLTNPAEEELLKQAETRTRAAEAIFRGIEAYFQKYR